MPYKNQATRRAHDALHLRERMEGNRLRAARRRGLLEFRHTDLPSEALFDEVWSAAKINAFLQDPEKIVKWALSRPDSLRDELLLFGVAAVLRPLRRCATAASSSAIAKQVATRNEVGKRRLRAVIDGSKQFTRIVELLDAHSVGGKVLGDCTKGDLLRAAADAEAAAGEATMNAQFYRLLAGMIPEHGVTVRQANNRKEIVALLTTTFREEDELKGHVEEGMLPWRP